jgi:1-aminocyclopropane-1-carboxylate deaminase/D-cysteine desulfhydrase-like pyridoxal-dependent ACC family enzyme
MNGEIRIPSPIEELNDSLFIEKEVKVYLKRDDLINEKISGNKWRKLKYNIQAAKKKTILTFGGAFSNHIAATAAACYSEGLASIGIIRGERPKTLNNTLKGAEENGMHLEFTSRDAYRNKNELSFIKTLNKKFKNVFIVPEGGANIHGLKGCVDIIDEIKIDFDYIISAVGTGATISGIACGLKKEQQAIGIVVLKGAEYLQQEVNKLTREYQFEDKDIDIQPNMVLNHDYHFGGYAKIKPELVNFINSFYQMHGIKTDPIYSGKSLYALYDLIRNDHFKKGSRIVYYHCGGLQGVEGMEKRYSIQFFKS